MAACPGLVVLHDARLHQARAHDLLKQERFDDYRQEFSYDHPHARRDFVEYAVAGLGGPIYYCWPMLRVVMRTARRVAVHNARVAADLREEFPDVPVDAIHLGTAPFESADNAAVRARVRARFGVPESAVLFAAFGKMTAEKRIEVILRAFETIAGERGDVHLLLAGDTSECAAIDAGRFPRRCRRASMLPGTFRIRRSVSTWPPRTHAFACGGRRRWRRRRRGCNALRPESRRSSAIWLISSTFRPSIRPAGVRRPRPRSRSRLPWTCSTSTARFFSRCARWPTTRSCATRWDVRDTRTGA